MNIASVKFKGIENIYTRSKQEIKQTVKANNKDTIKNIFRRNLIWNLKTRK